MRGEPSLLCSEAGRGFCVAVFGLPSEAHHFGTLFVLLHASGSVRVCGEGAGVVHSHSLTDV